VAVTPDDTCIGGICVGMIDPDKDGIPNYGPQVVCDGPGLLQNCKDNCPFRANPGQEDGNNDGIGDACATPQWWMRVKTNQKVIALTFDDGWDDSAFTSLLDTLASKHAYASFFIIGSYYDDGTISKENLIRARNSGHLLGNHTFNHKVGDDLAGMVKEIMDTQNLYVNTGVGSLRPLYRCPSPGEELLPIMGTLTQALQQTGFVESFLANFDTGDWTDPEPPSDKMVQCVVEQAAPGDILSFHVGPQSTVDAIGQIIDQLAAKGFVFLTLEQMTYYGSPELLTPDQVKTCGAYYE